MTAYYHSGSSESVPAFDPTAPLTGGWTAEPAVPVQHIAWLVGTLPGSSGPYNITVTAIAAPPSGAAALPAGTPLRNFVEIFVSGRDQDPDNNTDEHTVRTPANDMALTKTGSTEGADPGLVPGDAILYEIVVENTGTEIAYGIEVQDILPAGLQLEAGGADGVLALVNAEGQPVLPVDADGNEITSAIPLTRAVTTNGVMWLFGSADVTSAGYYRNVGILPGQRQTITLAATVALDVPGGTAIDNTATVTIRNRNDTEPAEEYLGNNTDSSTTVVYRPDVAVRKSVVDAGTGSADWTDSGKLLTYTIEYNNLGDAVARDTVISEIVPEGTTLVSVENPDGSTVAYYPATGSQARSFDVHLGDLGPNPNKAVMVHYAAKTAAEIASGKSGMPLEVAQPSHGGGGFFGSSIATIGDVNGDGIVDLIVGQSENHNEIRYSGGAWILMMNTDGTVKEAVELANGLNGVPSGLFKYADRAGGSVQSLGDIDGDGVPDVIISQVRNDENTWDSGGAFIFLLNADGTAKSVVELQNGTNGVPAGSFLYGERIHPCASGVDMDGDGVPDVFMGAGQTSGFHLMLLNPDGTVKKAIRYRAGTNGIPQEAWSAASLSRTVVHLGDVDGNGVPDIAVGASPRDLQGGAWVVLLNPDLTAKSAVRLTNGYNGVPSDTFGSWAQGCPVSTQLGDFDGDGVPDLLLGAPGLAGTNDVRSGGAVIMLLNSNGTAKEVIKIANGTPGIPADLFRYDEQVRALGVIGDVDGDGVTDIMLGGWGYDANGSERFGALYMLLLNTDGTVKSYTRIADGESGMPAGVLNRHSYFGIGGTPIGDLNGDGIPILRLENPRTEPVAACGSSCRVSSRCPTTRRQPPLTARPKSSAGSIPVTRSWRGTSLSPRPSFPRAQRSSTPSDALSMANPSTTSVQRSRIFPIRCLRAVWISRRYRPRTRISS